MLFSASRTSRTVGGVVVSAVIAALLITSSAAAETPDEVTAVAESLVGTPREVLIESSSAVGKVLEIGNTRAEQASTPVAPAPAAAASFTRATTPAAIAAQRVLVYPVIGQTTVLLANAGGTLLVRRPNAGSDFRYLSTSTVSLEAAAVDPYAQWRLVDAGNGLFAINSAQADGSGRTPSLDMYNWRNQDAAEIQTYDAGTAAVQRWRIQSLTPTVTAPATRTVTPGAVPAMPESLTASYAWGLAQKLTPITWTMPDAAVWNVDGLIEVSGTAPGFFGEPVAVAAKFQVGSLGNPAESVLNTYSGVSLRQLQIQAPRSLSRPVSGSTQTVTADVSWDWSQVTDASFATAGTVVVPSITGLGYTASLRIVVTPSASTNLLRKVVSHPAATYVDGTTKLVDGSRTVTGFSDWRSGGATNRVNPNKVTLYLDTPQQITGVGVFDQGGTNNIGKVSVQVRDVRGGWVDLAAHNTTWPVTNSATTLSLVVSNDPLLVTAVRVTITSKSTATWMTLSEIELYGPSAAL